MYGRLMGGKIKEYSMQPYQTPNLIFIISHHLILTTTTAPTPTPPADNE